MCKDSTDDDFSDSDSSKTEGYAVLDVEYEVASTTDGDDSGSSASSGTDEFAYEAATAAYYEFNALMNRNQDMSDAESDDFILADTEDDTDGSCDLELGQADYWKCIKCNNKQNNPLYRFCEKCYQVSFKFYIQSKKNYCTIFFVFSKSQSDNIDETCRNVFVKNSSLKCESDVTAHVPYVRFHFCSILFYFRIYLCVIL